MTEEVENPAQTALDLWEVGAHFEAIIILVDAIGKLTKENAELKGQVQKLMDKKCCHANKDLC